jgi:hypothetical protein
MIWHAWRVESDVDAPIGEELGGAIAKIQRLSWNVAFP